MSFGPAGFLESRTATVPATRATAPHWPTALLWLRWCRRTAGLAPRRGVVDDPPRRGRAVAAQDVLPLHPDLDPALDLVAAGRGEPAADHGPGVVLGLEQAGHEQRLVVPDAARLPLETDVG